jgi:hypothetical protein
VRGELPSTPFEQRQKSVSADPSSSNEVGYDIFAYFLVARDYERPSHSRFFHFNVTTLLASKAVPQLFEYTDDFLPTQRG